MYMDEYMLKGRTSTTDRHLYDIKRRLRSIVPCGTTTNLASRVLTVYDCYVDLMANSNYKSTHNYNLNET